MRVARHILLLVALCPALALAQSPAGGEAGRPYYAQRYSANDYGLHNQNWDVVQDERGVVYVANRNGVLEFDGQAWRTIRVPNELIRSLALGPGGTVYVGGVREVGYLASDSLGSTRYVSLLDRLPEADRTFADVWTTLVTEAGVFFQTFDRVLRWDGHRMHAWATDDRFHKAFVAHDRYFVREEGVGLLEVVGDELRPLPGGDRFAHERVDVVLPHGDEAFLIQTRTDGFLRFDGAAFRRFATEADRYLSDKRVYQSAVLHDSSYALTTTSGSVVLMEQGGHVTRVLGADVGLRPDDLVLAAYPDQQRGLWLALDNGLLRVDVPAALTLFDGRSGLEGTVYEMVRHGGTLYAATTQGFFRLRPGEVAGDSKVFDPPRFERVAGIESQSYQAVSTEDGIIVVANDGIYEVNGAQARRVTERKAFALWMDEDGTRIFAGLKQGVSVLGRGPGGWVDAGVVEGVSAEVRSIGRGPDGALWMGTLLEGVLRVELDEGLGATVTRYGAEHGLPEGPTLVWRSGDDLLFHTMQGVYRLDGDGPGLVFKPDTALNAVIGPDGATHYVVSGSPEEGLWVAKEREVEVFRADEHGALVNRTPAALRIPGVRIRAVFDEGGGVVWVATEEGLFRYDGTMGKTYAEPYRALVRRVRDRRGDTLFGGGTLGDVVPRIPHEQNGLRFTFSAPAFNAPEANRFQYWLEGFDDGWSDWSDETHKEYTNLPEKTYRFHVRARNGQDVISRADVFTFRVLPPWYRTWWAYTLYGLGAAFVMWAYGQFRLRHHAAELERERDVNRQLETANARLREANERLELADKLKDDLLANTSHELRTPLTSILGFASVLREELDGEARTFATMIQQGGERLLGTVNALLDMAHLRADLMETEPVELDVVAAVEEVVRGFDAQAAAKGLQLEVETEAPSVPARMDRAGLERILTNLVGNAIKFTSEGGVTVRVGATDERVLLAVRDTGIGIAKEFVPHLFGEFKQASSGYARAFEGNGLGLAITQRMVHLLGGDIEVESEVGSGTEFRLRLPRYAAPEASPPDEDAEPLLSPLLRVLVVEEPGRPQLRLRRLLDGPGLEVATGAEAGLEALQQARFDLLFVDTQLSPLSSDLPLLEALRCGPEPPPAIAVATHALPGDGELYRRLGFAAHLGRPITKRRLRRAIEAALAERELADVDA